MRPHETKVEQTPERDEHLRWVRRTIGFGLLLQLTLASLGVAFRDENPTPPPKPEEQPSYLIGSVQRVVDSPETVFGTLDHIVITTCLKSQTLIDSLTTAESDTAFRKAWEEVLTCEGSTGSVTLSESLSETSEEYRPQEGEIVVTALDDRQVWVLDNTCPPYGQEAWELDACGRK